MYEGDANRTTAGLSAQLLGDRMMGNEFFVLNGQRFPLDVVNDVLSALNFKVPGYLSFQGCTSLISLPDGLEVDGYLNLGGCFALARLPRRLKVGGYLNLLGCTSLPELPDDLEVCCQVIGWGHHHFKLAC
jgi:hypothetical protein